MTCVWFKADTSDTPPIAPGSSIHIIVKNGHVTLEGEWAGTAFRPQNTFFTGDNPRDGETAGPSKLSYGQHKTISKFSEIIKKPN